MMKKNRSTSTTALRGPNSIAPMLGSRRPSATPPPIPNAPHETPVQQQSPASPQQPQIQHQPPQQSSSLPSTPVPARGLGPGLRKNSFLGSPAGRERAESASGGGGWSSGVGGGGGGSSAGSSSGGSGIGSSGGGASESPVDPTASPVQGRGIAAKFLQQVNRDDKPRSQSNPLSPTSPERGEAAGNGVEKKEGSNQK